MSQGMRVDTSRFTLKTLRVKREVMKIAPQLVMEAANELHKLANKNLSGPGYGTHSGPLGGLVAGRGPMTGKMPVPRITGTLAGSLQIKPLSPFCWTVFADQKRAPYAVYVYYGTKYVQPRKFIPVDIQRPKALAKWNTVIKLIIRSAGG